MNLELEVMCSEGKFGDVKSGTVIIVCFFLVYDVRMILLFGFTSS